MSSDSLLIMMVTVGLTYEKRVRLMLMVG